MTPQEEITSLKESLWQKEQALAEAEKKVELLDKHCIEGWDRFYKLQREVVWNKDAAEIMFKKGWDSHADEYNCKNKEHSHKWLEVTK